MLCLLKEGIKSFNEIFQKIYAHEMISITSYYEVARQLGIEDHLSINLEKQAEEYLKNKKIIAAADEMYAEMNKRAEIMTIGL